MTSILDIVQSAIIAALIALMVLGVHFMTSKSATENRVYQQMQGLADGTLAVLQEEIRYVNNFLSEQVTMSSNYLYFRNVQGNYVLLTAADNILDVTEVSKTSEIYNGNTDVTAFDDHSIQISGLSIQENNNYLVEIIAESIVGYDQVKLIDTYEGGTVYIKGGWDVIPPTGTNIIYKIFDTDTVRERSYSLNIVDRSDDDIYVFNLVSIDEYGSDENLAGPTINPIDIDAVKVDIAIRSREDQLYQDSDQEFVLDLQKHFYLRGFRLPSVSID